jgi:glycosyltransferase involved in cell wall biosynthesis/GT2 family glycosyltransferase
MLRETEPSVSVVIATLNRSALLRKCLTSLKYQNYSNFEVIVVNGPSTDDTLNVLESLRDTIVVGQVSEANLSKSRNAGIALSRGELVLFLDDDAFAEPDWIAHIVSGYKDPKVGAVGTRVYDYTGFNWQGNPFLLDEYYAPVFEHKAPLWAFEFRDSKYIPHILGASSSFRRSVLVEIGGFDEEIEYFLDESELCRRVTEAGYRVRLLQAGACVHHKFASGVTRDERRILTHPYAAVKNKLYCCLSACRKRSALESEYLDNCNNWVNGLLDNARWNLENQRLTQAEYDRFATDVERGVRDGRERALGGSRKSAKLPPASPTELRHYSTLNPPAGRRTICLVSRWIPRRSPGGVARYMWDLATGFASRGHDVHLITASVGPAVVEYEGGLWIHSLADEDIAVSPVAESVVAALGDFDSAAARNNVAWARAAYSEVLRLREGRYIDLVVAPTWDQEGLYCAMDRSLLTVVSMNTTFRKYADFERENIDANSCRELRLLENLYIRNAGAFHANSDASAEHLKTAFGVGVEQPIVKVPHGVADISADSLDRAERRRIRRDGALRILYVSRLESRKGTDLFLDAAAELVKCEDNVEVLLVGRDSYTSDPKRSYQVTFELAHRELADRIKFLGQVSDVELAQLFEDADIFCVPSRFESFGIVFVEAMRYGIPIVAGNTGGVPEIVVDGETGIVCEEPTSGAIGKALARLIRDPEFRRSLGGKGRQRYLELFEHDVIVDRTLSAFVGLMDRGTRPSV